MKNALNVKKITSELYMRNLTSKILYSKVPITNKKQRKKNNSS